MKAGDTLIYANGKRVKIVNFPTLNGQPGVQLDDPDGIFAHNSFKLRSEIDKWVGLGIWKIEATQQGERNA